MTDEYERFVNFFIHFFDNMTNIYKCAWFLDKQTLVDIVCNRRVTGKIHVGIINCKMKYIHERAASFDTKTINEKECIEIIIQNIPVEIKLYDGIDEIICASQEDIDQIRKRDSSMALNGVWRLNLSLFHWYNFPVPYKTGTYLDKIMPLWFTKIEHSRYNEDANRFFNVTRTGNALELMGLLKECAVTAGIGEYIFPGFGTLLGIIREGGFIGTDRDLDHCIMGNKITEEQENKFLKEVGRSRIINDKLYPKGLHEGRWRNPSRRKDTDRFLWTSCGHKKIKSQEGVKSCIWKMFEHDEIIWHSKGGRWVHPAKFRKRKLNLEYTEDAVAKGIEAKYLNEFIEMDFKGIKINVPKLAGSVLDAWYSGWPIPKNVQSSDKILMIIPDWGEPKKWYRV